VANPPDRHLLSDPETQAWLEASANRLVAELLAEERALARIDGLSPADDADFARRLVDTELGFMADGFDPMRIYLRLAVMRTARTTLRARTEIRNLPEQTPTRTRHRCDLRSTTEEPGNAA
jgi:hypothetical protein